MFGFDKDYGDKAGVGGADHLLGGLLVHVEGDAYEVHQIEDAFLAQYRSMGRKSAQSAYT